MCLSHWVPPVPGTEPNTLITNAFSHPTLDNTTGTSVCGVVAESTVKRMAVPQDALWALSRSLSHAQSTLGRAGRSPWILDWKTSTPPPWFPAQSSWWFQGSYYQSGPQSRDSSGGLYLWGAQFEPRPLQVYLICPSKVGHDPQWERYIILQLRYICQRFLWNNVYIHVRPSDSPILPHSFIKNENVEKLEPFYITSGNVKQPSLFGKVWCFLKIWDTELSKDLEILLLCIQEHEIHPYKNLNISAS